MEKQRPVTGGRWDEVVMRGMMLRCRGLWKMVMRGMMLRCRGLWKMVVRGMMMKMWGEGRWLPPPLAGFVGEDGAQKPGVVRCDAED